MRQGGSTPFRLALTEVAFAFFCKRPVELFYRLCILIQNMIANLFSKAQYTRDDVSVSRANVYCLIKLLNCKVSPITMQAE